MPSDFEENGEIPNANSSVDTESPFQCVSNSFHFIIIPKIENRNDHITSKIGDYRKYIMRLFSKFLSALLTIEEKSLTIEEKTFATIWIFNKSRKVAREIALDEKHGVFVSECFVQTIMGTIKDMKKLSEKAKDINIEQVVRLTVDNELQKIAGGTPTTHIHWAPTQSGKSAFKAIKILVYLMMNVPVVVITKGKSESKELESKISSYLEGSRFAFENRVFSVYEEDIEISFPKNEEACCTIIPDSYQKIELAHYLLSESVQSPRGCAVILDEVDAIIHRSEEQEQKNEKALIRLQEEFKPSMTMVTATPIPLFTNLKGKISFTTSNKRIVDYIGVQDMINTDVDPESLTKGEPIDGVVEISPNHIHKNVCKSEISMRQYVLEHALFETDCAQLAKKFPKVCHTANIPRINSECIGFLKRDMTITDAVGMLALVDTCPWVDSTKKGTLFQQASGVQDFFAVLGHKFVAIIVHAEKIFYRLPGHRNGFRCYKPMAELLDKIDKKFGLQMPVIVFGYHAMKRSRSYRSNNRVPSCIIMCLGKGQSAENCRQAAGRATTKGRSLLLHNRKTDKVPILCPQEDFRIIQKYDLLTEEIIVKLHKEGLSWEDTKLSLSPENNFLDDCHRRFGNFIPASEKRKRKRTRSQSANRSSEDDEDAILPQLLVCNLSSGASLTKIGSADSKGEYKQKSDKNRKHFGIDSNNVQIKIENCKNKRQRSGGIKMVDLTYGDQDCAIDLTEDKIEEKESNSSVNSDKIMIDLADSSEESVIDLADGDDKYCAIDLVEGDDWEMV